MKDIKSSKRGVLVFVLVFGLILAGCDSDKGDSTTDGSTADGGGGTLTLPAPNVTAIKLLTFGGVQYGMISFDLVPEATGYVLFISKSNSDNFIHYADEYAYGTEDINYFSRFTTPFFNSAFESILSPTSADAFRNANQGYIHSGTRDTRGTVQNVAVGTYFYKIYAYGSDSINGFIRSPDSVVVSITID